MRSEGYANAYPSHNSMRRHRLLPTPPPIPPRRPLILSRRSRRSRRLNPPNTRLLSESNRQHLINPLNRLDLQIPLDVVRNLNQILLVFVRNQHSLDPPPMSRQELLLQPADGQHFAAQGDLARHRDIRPHRNLRQRRNQRRAHSDTGTRSVLRSGTFRDVQVNVELLIELGFEA